MIFEFRLPDLGEGIAEGEIVKWRVKEGEDVLEHQVALEIETDKAIVEVPSPKKGRVARLHKNEGETVNVGTVLFSIEYQEKEALFTKESLAGSPERPEKKEAQTVVGVLPEAHGVLAAPKARVAAKRLNIDLKAVSGTGPGGIITETDVISASKARPVAEAQGAEKIPAKEAMPGETERIPIKGVRKSIARNILQTLRTAASVTGMDDADVTELWELRKREQDEAQEKGMHLTFMPFFMKAVQHALKEHPMLNASVDEKAEEIIVKKYCNIGVAVDTPDGLMVSVVKNVDRKTILELAGELQVLSKKARERKITLDELKGSSFTISNYGTFGGTYATPIINYPDVAILGAGKISERPWVKDKKIVIRKILPLSVTFDHRVVDGRDAALFLSKVIRYLEDPAKIFIESA